MELSERQLEEMHDDFLDDVYGEVEIAGLRYMTSDVLREIDSVAYNESYHNWLDYCLTNEDLFEHADGTIHDCAEEDSTEEEEEEEPA